MATRWATSATLTLASVTPEQAGHYSVEARNATSSLMSYAVELKVGWSQLVALSSRAPAGTGEQTLIMGFAFAGAGSKPLLVRGVGPGRRGLLGGHDEAAASGRFFVRRDHGPVTPAPRQW